MKHNLINIISVALEGTLIFQCLTAIKWLEINLFHEVKSVV